MSTSITLPDSVHDRVRGWSYELFKIQYNRSITGLNWELLEISPKSEKNLYPWKVKACIILYIEIKSESQYGWVKSTQINDMDTDNMADAQLPSPSTHRDWPAESADCWDRASVLPPSNTAVLSPPAPARKKASAVIVGDRAPKQNAFYVERIQHCPHAPSPIPDHRRGLDLLPGIPLPSQQWPPTTAPPPPPPHSLTPTEDYMLSGTKKLHFLRLPGDRRRRGPPLGSRHSQASPVGVWPRGSAARPRNE